MPSIEQIDVDEVLVGLKHAAATTEGEEPFKLKVYALIESEVTSKLGIAPGKYEYTLVSGGRPDALYGHVIIEYKAPGKLLREPDVARAKEQLIGYIKKEAEVEDRFKLFLGVILADRIGFVRYDEKGKSWLLRGPYDLNRETVLRLVEAIRGLRRKKLAVDELLRDFGPKSDTAVKMVSVFYGKVMSSKSPKVEAGESAYRPVEEFTYVLPNDIRENDPAKLIDRVHGIIPGWELPKISMSTRHLSRGCGIASDYFCETMHELRKQNYTHIIDQETELTGDYTIRDERSVKRIANGLLKLINPNESIDKTELKTIMDIAIEYRKRVNDWLHIRAPGEFPKKELNYTLK